MPMRATHCITKCGYAINGDKPCPELAKAIDEFEASLIPLIAETPLSNAFARAFAKEVDRAREFKITGVIPARNATPIVHHVGPPIPVEVVTDSVAPPAAEPAPEKEYEMADPTTPAAPPAPDVEPEQLVADPTPAPVASAPLATPMPAVAVTFPKRSKAEVLAPPAPAPVPKTPKPPKASKKSKPEKEAPMPRGIPNDPSKPRAKRAVKPTITPGAILIMVESRAGSGKFVITDGDLPKMISLKAAGRRVLVVMQHSEL
jgi:hypothetical protein